MRKVRKKAPLQRLILPASFAFVILLAAGAFLLHGKPSIELRRNDAHADSPVSAPVRYLADETPLAQRPLRDKLIAMLDPKDPNTIFKVVDAIQADPAVAANCHEMAHDIGHAAYKLYGFADAMTFDNPSHIKHALVSSICAGGYMHGILEQMSIDRPDFMQKPEIICDQVSDADRASCFHGMGHVFMVANERDVPASITDCRVIEKSADMYRCFEGVRMEQFWGTAELGDDSTLGWDPQNPLGTCIAAPKDEKPTCFLYSTFGYLRVHPKDYPGAAKLCTQSGLDDSDAEFCLKGLGMTMMSKFKGQNMERSEVYVEGFPDSMKLAFYQGVNGYASLSGLSAQDLETACGKLVNDTGICLEAMEGN